MTVWVLMWYGEFSAQCCGVVSDQKTADEWALQGAGNEAHKFEVDKLPIGFKKGILNFAG